MLMRPSHIALLALLFASAAACNRDQLDSQTGGRPPGRDTTRTISGIVVSAAEINGACGGEGAECTSFPDGLLEDGFFSIVEFERALLDYVQCMDDAGISIEPISEPSGQWVIKGTYLLQDHSQADDNAGPCNARFRPLQALWGKYESPEYPALARRATKEFESCLQGEGVEREQFLDGFTNVLAVYPEAYGMCLRIVKDTYGLFSWSP